MRKFLLLTALAVVAQISNAQAPVAKAPSVRNVRISPASNEEKPVVTNNPSNTNTSRIKPAAHNTTAGNNSKSLINGTALNSVKIGSAGNLLTVTTFNCNQLYNNDPLGLVAFVHRSDPTVNAQLNIAEYSFDFSQNGGTTWKNNIGPITVAPVGQTPIDNNGSNPHGRFPQGLIYNPVGNTLVDSAYLIYSGTWHNAAVNATDGTWVGQMRGRGNFNGDSSTFNVHVDTINNGTTDIATGMCQSIPGTFWAVNEDWNGTFSTSSPEITQGIIVEKGVWDSIAHDVVWTNSEIFQTFDSFSTGSVNISAAQSFDIAFDPTGQYGWISCLGDVSLAPVDSVISPIFWKTVDSGNTWTGPIQIDLTTLPGVVNGLNTATLYTTSASQETGLLTSGIPTTSFEAKLAVDYNGNPHLLTTIGNGGSYSIESGAGYIVYDITLNPGGACIPTNDSGWAAVFIDSVATLRGTTTSDPTPLTEDNRPLVSRSADGKKLFFFWEASDPNFPAGAGQGDNNNTRNLFARGFDVAHQFSTRTVNLTEGDPAWGGPDLNFPNSTTYSAANYPTISPITISGTNKQTVPLVLTQIDYLNNLGTLGLSTNPAQFYYISNVAFNDSDFTNSAFVTLTPISADTVSIPQYTGYADSGATVGYVNSNCNNFGTLHVVTQNTVDTAVAGVYYVYYWAEDSVGDIFAKAQRVVIVTSTAAVQKIDLASAVNLFPNPTSGNVSIALSGNSIPDFTVSAYNILGAQVLPTSDYKSGTTSVELNAGMLADGVYLVKIQSEQGTVVKRLTVSHK